MGGRPRQTPCLPWNFAGNGWQPVARDFACLCGLRAGQFCRWLPSVATAGVHKGSILQAFGGRRHAPLVHRLT
jgi:hypothetical protein